MSINTHKINGVLINKDNSLFILPIKGEESFYNQKEKYLLDHGFYNGDLLVCTNFSIENDILKVDAQKMKFFDWILNKFGRTPTPLINVNAIIEVEDSIILIKRGNDVYDYKNYWDFPAGLVHFDETLNNRLVDRIYEDTKINEKDLLIDKEPSLVFANKKFFSLYYAVTCKLTKQEIQNIFTTKFKGNAPILLKKSEIESFLEKNKRVFPKEIMLSIDS